MVYLALIRHGPTDSDMVSVGRLRPGMPRQFEGEAAEDHGGPGPGFLGCERVSRAWIQHKDQSLGGALQGGP